MTDTLKFELKKLYTVKNGYFLLYPSVEVVKEMGMGMRMYGTEFTIQNFINYYNRLHNQSLFYLSPGDNFMVMEKDDELGFIKVLGKTIGWLAPLLHVSTNSYFQPILKP